MSDDFSEHVTAIADALKEKDAEIERLTKALVLVGTRIPAREPTEAMLIAARDWSYGKYGKPIGNDAAKGCWQVMFDALNREAA